MFSLKHPVENGTFLGNDDIIYTVENGRSQAVMTASDIRIPGMHNVANYLTAISAVQGCVVSEVIQKVAKEFVGVEHRIEFVRELDGVKWYNDSIATSPTRAIAGLHAFKKKLIIIAGGYDKKIPFEPLAPELIDKVKILILTGSTAEKIVTTIKLHPDYKSGCPEIIMAANIPEAVRVAHEMAKKGDIVSLSPACASFDAYPNFEARGRHFKELVANIK